jgi:hypothetical protein
MPKRGLLSGIMVNVLTIGPKVCRFKPAEVTDFKGNKNQQYTFLQMGSKAGGPIL